MVMVLADPPDTEDEQMQAMRLVVTVLVRLGVPVRAVGWNCDTHLMELHCDDELA